MTHIADYTTEDLAAGILGLHDRPHKEMVAIATKAINAAIAAAVQAEREACENVAQSDNVRHGLTRAEITTGDQVAASIAAAIRARSNGNK